MACTLHVTWLSGSSSLKWIGPQPVYIVSSPAKIISFSGGGSGNGEGLEKVQRLIGQANSDDKCIGFGPPPPSDADAGSGFINLLGREELMSGSRKFSEPSPLGRSGKSSPLRQAPRAASSRDRATDAPPPSVSEPAGVLSPSENVKRASSSSFPEAAEEKRESLLLPSPLTPSQRVVALGLLGVTLVAFGKSSKDLVPDNVLFLLQAWMLLAWGSHLAMGLIAALLAPGKGQPGSKWLLKVLTTGALGFREFWNLPDKRR